MHIHHCFICYMKIYAYIQNTSIKQTFNANINLQGMSNYLVLFLGKNAMYMHVI